MRYLFLAYQDETQLAGLSASERNTFENACRASDELLRQSGYLHAMEHLQSSRTATTVRVLNGPVSVADGPLSETNEQLTGLFFVNARDLNEAIQVASKMPQAGRGPIEVRPILEF